MINTQKCHEIRSISEDGVLQCYAEDGSQSAPVSPASDWQVREFDKTFDFAWGSEEHQAFLHYLCYGGGFERIAKQILDSAAFAIQLHQTIDSLSSPVYDPGSTSAAMPKYGANPVMLTMSVWEARGFSLADWHFKNATFYTTSSNLMVGSGGQRIQRVGNIGFDGGGMRSFYFGDYAYHSNGSASIATSSTSSYNNRGENCLKITENIVRCFGG